MKSLVIAALTSVTVLAVSCQEEFPLTPEQRIEQLAKSHLIFGNAPGISVGTFQNGQRRYYNYGSRSATANEPVNERTIYEIASVSKTFTAYLVADLSLQGRLSLDDSANKFLPPALRLPSKEGTPILIKHLLNHTSGLKRDIDFTGLPQTDYTEAQLADYLKTSTLNFVPGSEFSYSNLGFDVLASIAQIVAGKSYEAQLEERMLRPMKMAATYATDALPSSDNTATGYLGKKKIAHYKHTSVSTGAGAVKSNVDDLLTYVEFAMNSTPSETSQVFDLVQRPTFTIRSGTEIGLSWIKSGKNLYFHNGGFPGYSSVIIFDQAKKTAVVLLANGGPINTTQTAFDILKLLE